MSRSANPVPSGARNSAALPPRSIRMLAGVDPRPPTSPFSIAIASSISATRQNFSSLDRNDSKAGRSSFFSAASRFSILGLKAALGSTANLFKRSWSGSGISSAASTRSANGLNSLRSALRFARASALARGAGRGLQEAASLSASWSTGKRLNQSSASSAVTMVRRPTLRTRSRPVLTS
jgi:hypothetical protein